MPSDCSECNELKRHLVLAENEYRFLLSRTKSRQASRAERRRIHRLKTDSYVARQLLQNHQSLCKESA